MRCSVIIFGVAHQSHVHIIEMAPADKFSLTGQKLNVVLFSKIHTVADLNQFFSGYSDKCDSATELTADV